MAHSGPIPALPSALRWKSDSKGNQSYRPSHDGGAVAQFGERVNGIDEVRVSNPLGSTRLDVIKNFSIEVQVDGVIALLGTAIAC